MTGRKAAPRRRRPQTSLQRLRERLRLAEDTLAAIRDGHVDALVIRAADGDQLYTLRTADQPYRLMVERMREGALIVSEQGIILYANTCFVEMAGVPETRVTAQPLTNFIHDDGQQLARLLSATNAREEFQLRHLTDGARPVQLSSIAMTIEGVRTIAVVVTDLSPERTARGLSESNRLKDEFLATLSHELRTPLNVVLGWTRMLLSNQLTPDARLHALQLIERNAQVQAQLVNDLVDMSRITTGKLQLNLESVPLVPALDAAIEGVRLAAEAKHLTLNAHWPMMATTVLADPTRFQQVLWNLLSNAIKFTPPRGRVTVSAFATDGQVRIDVSDSGVGIDPSFVPQVFDRFRQADSGTTRAHGGLGLGLAIVRDLVWLHGGTVQAKSDGIGRGSTFVVTWPVSRRATDGIQVMAQGSSDTTAVNPRRPDDAAVSLGGSVSPWSQRERRRR